MRITERLTPSSARLCGLVLFTLASLAVHALAPQASAQSTISHSSGSFDLLWIQYPDEQGYGYLYYDGQEELSSQYLLNHLEQRRCIVQTLWIPEQRIGYHRGAIERGIDDIVNNAFYNTTIQKGDTITVQCEQESIQQETGNENIEPEDVNIDETHIHWITYPETNTHRNKQGQATIQYGGGSFYQLVSRLSTEGCNVDTLTIKNTHYSFHNTNQENKEFNQNYKEYIQPNTIITIACVDNCEVVYGLDLVENQTYREFIQNTEKCRDLDLLSDLSYYYDDTNIVSYTECHTNWSEGALYFLSRVPVFQDVCQIDIFEHEVGSSRGFAVLPFYLIRGALYQGIISGIAIKMTHDPSQRRPDIEILQTELHELCHIHQGWYTYKEYLDYDNRKNHLSHEGVIFGLWYETPMAQELIDMIGFISYEEDGRTRYYIEDPNSIFNTGWDGYYNTNPFELSAELCANYFLKKIDPEGSQRYVRVHHITPEIEQWIETYIALPE